MDPIEIGVQDAHYWRFGPERDRETHRRLYKAGMRGMLLGAPGFVSLDERDTLPIALARIVSAREAAAVDFDEQAVLSAFDVERGELRVSRLVVREDGFMKAPRIPGEDPGEGTVSRIYHADLHSQLGIPWRPATLLVAVSMRGQMTNRVRVELGRSEQAYRDPEVARFLEERSGRQSYDDPWPRARTPFPCYRALQESPPVPEEPGMELTGNRVVVLEPEVRSVLRASFRLPLSRHQIVPPTEVRDGLLVRAGSPQPPTAVVPIALLVVGSDLPSPAVVPLRVPVWEPIADPPQSTVTGHFAIDLLQLDGIARTGQTYFVFAFNGEHMAGPISMALVDPSMLPAGR